jgi:hypothetical protein
MKNKLTFLSLLLTIVGGLIMMSLSGCSTSADDTTKFEGKWSNSYSNNATYIFTGYDVAFFPDGISQEWTGTFTFTDTTITFRPSNSAAWTQGYTLSASTLTLAQVESVNYGPFTKQ